MLKFLRCWSLLVGLLLAPRAFAQLPAVWAPDPTLSRAQVQQAVLDSTGFRWLATDEGVFRYDGFDLLPLARFVRHGAQLPLTMVRSLTFDPAGRLWIASDVGLFCFNQRTATLRAVPLQLPSADKPGVDLIWCHPRTGQLWVNSKSGRISVFDPRATQAKPSHWVRIGRGALALCATRRGGGVWATLATKAIAELSATGTPGRVIPTPAFGVPLPAARPLRFVTATALFELSDSRTQPWRELQRWLPAASNARFSPLVTDSTLTWICHGNLVQLRGAIAATPQVLTLGTNLPPQDTAVALLADSNGSWWGWARGVRGTFRARPVRPQVACLPTSAGQTAPSTRCLARLPDGRLLVSTYSGTFTQAADSPAAPLRPWRITRAEGDHGAPVFYAVQATPSGKLVVADEVFGFGILDPATGLVRYFTLTEADRDPAGRALVLDGLGQLWGGSAGGLYRLDPLAERAYAVGAGRPDWPLHGREVLGMAPDPGHPGALWLATVGGVFWVDPNDGRFERFGLHGPARRRLPTDAALCVTAAGPGRVWVGTRDQGLLLVDRQRGLLSTFGVTDGLPSATVAAVLQRTPDELWLSTFDGLVRLAPVHRQMAVFGTAEGLAATELNRCAALLDGTGQGGALGWVGGIGGVYRFQPTRLGVNAGCPRPRLLVAATRRGTHPEGSEALVPENGRLIRPLRLPAAPLAFVALDLALTDVFAPEQARFAYRLIPKNASAAPTPWFDTPRRLVLRGVSPGTYMLEIRGEAAPGRPALNLLQIPLYVAAPWWQHPVVWFAAALILIGIGYGLYWLKLRRAAAEGA
jgi:streptogramin lyase